MTHEQQTPYYAAYEQRYQAAYQAGAERWGHAPDDEALNKALEAWVAENHLAGRRVLEFACGEGACGVILSRLGCVYHGVDMSPSAVQKTKDALAPYKNASAAQLDMVRQTISQTYDAALDCMGLHMLVTDDDRKAYLRNAYAALCPGAPMLFFRESYQQKGAYRGEVRSVEQWKAFTGGDYDTPQPRIARTANGDVEVCIPILPARAKDENGYIAEMQSAGFAVEHFVVMQPSDAMYNAASIYVRKPK